MGPACAALQACLTNKAISKRSGLALVVQYIELEVDASAVGHTAFGVMDQ